MTITDFITRWHRLCNHWGDINSRNPDAIAGLLPTFFEQGFVAYTDVLKDQSHGKRPLQPQRLDETITLAWVLMGSGQFDGDAYLHRYPDVVQSGTDPVIHYAQHGWQEGRIPQEGFDPAWYAREHLGPARGVVDPFLHYILIGKAQALPTSGAPVPRSMTPAEFVQADSATVPLDNHWAFPVCAYDHTFGGNERAVFETVRDDPAIHKVILTRSRLVDVAGANVTVLPLHSRDGQEALLKSRFVFVKHGPYINVPWPLSERHDVINLWHGIALKRIGTASLDSQRPETLAFMHKVHAACRAVITSSRIDTLVMAASFAPLGYDNFWPTGLPRNDYITCKEDRLPVDMRQELAELRAELNGRRLIMFLPTFKNGQADVYYKFTSEQIARLQTWATANNAVFGVREHMADTARVYSTQLAPLQPIDLSSRRFSNLEVLYRAASALISDYSSCLVDFMLTGLPLISFAYDYDRYAGEERGLYYDLERVLPGPVCRDFDALSRALDRLFDERSASERQEYEFKRGIFFDYLDDGAAARVAERVKALMMPAKTGGAVRPKISVIIPSHSPTAHEWLGACLASLSRQTLTKDLFEVIVIVNGPPPYTQADSIAAQAMQTGLNVRVLHTEIAGPYHPRNMGLDAARGDFITYVDDDDQVAPRFLEGLLAHAQPGRIVVSRVGFVENSDFSKPSFNNYFTTGFMAQMGKQPSNMALAEHLHPTWAKLAPIEIARSARWNVNIKWAGDTVYWASVMAASKPLLALGDPREDAAYFYNLRAGSWMNFDKQNSYAMQVGRRLDLIGHLAGLEIADNEASAIREFLQWRQYRQIGNYLRQVASDFPQAQAEIKQRGLANVPWYALPDLKARQQQTNAVTSPEFLPQTPEIDVVMTTIHSRLESLPKVIQSLLTQTLPPRSIQIHVSEDAHLLDAGINPKDATLKQLTQHPSIQIHWTKNTGPFRKIVPYLERHFAEKKQGEKIFVTVDDDTIYPDYFLQTLYENYTRYGCVIAFRGRKITTADNKILPYKDWLLGTPYPHLSNTPTGKDGVLYSTKFFTPSILDIALAQKLTPTADDFWIKWHCAFNGVNALILNPEATLSEKKSFPSLELPNTVASLWRAYNQKDMADNKNDQGIKALETHYRQSTGNTLASLLNGARKSVPPQSPVTPPASSSETFSSADYWSKRYRKGGNSGAGSYGRLAQFKAEVINDFVETRQVKTIIEYGCGDGAQLKLAQYPSYIGFDVAPESIAMCKSIFAHDTSKTFFTVAEYAGQRADLTMSLDVIYHLIEDSVFHDYMERLFDSSDRYVIIYASNYEKTWPARHVRHRKFTDWIDQHRSHDFKLIKHIPNRFPLIKDEINESFADFYMFAKSV
jgi:CDP-glycerol glycerophosphotransferase (TagB/SpsB family)/glycosyltransferase involved in cell wall biosynthesis